MILHIFPLPRAPGGGGKIIRAIARSIHGSNSYQIGRFLKKMMPKPPCTPPVPPLGHDPRDGMKILSDMFYIFHL